MKYKFPLFLILVKLKLKESLKTQLLDKLQVCRLNYHI